MKWFKKKEKSIKEKSFQERMMEDWGKKDVYGPWIKSEDMKDENGLPKMFKDFYLVTDNNPCEIQIIDKLNDYEDTIKYLEFRQQNKKKL